MENPNLHTEAALKGASIPVIYIKPNKSAIMSQLASEENFSLKSHLVIEGADDNSVIHLMYFFCKNFDKMKHHLVDLHGVLRPIPDEINDNFTAFSSLVDAQKQMNYLYNILAKGKYPFFFEFLYNKMLGYPFLSNLLVYIQDYLSIFEAFIINHCKGREYYDKE